jgi:putative ABC transport system ATP-binding protein
VARRDSGRLWAHDVSLSFRLPGGDRLQALDIEELVIEPGSVVGILGPSGSGKTSLLYALTGIVRPERGTVRWGEVEITSLKEGDRDRWRRRNVGFIFQDFNLVAGMSALQNVLVPATFEQARPSKALRERAHELLARVGAPKERDTVDLMSRGEMQRVAVARALIMSPGIIIADEPIASLDADNARAVIDLLMEISRERGSTLITVTHDPLFVERLDVTHHLLKGRLGEPAKGKAA